MTMAIHPISHGFGWVAFEGAQHPYDWGTVRVTKQKNETCLRRGSRIARLCQALTALAIERGMQVATYTLKRVQEAFAGVGGRFRHEIAEAVCDQFPIFRHQLPKKRRAWESERESLSIFSAAALVVTHFAN